MEEQIKSAMEVWHLVNEYWKQETIGVLVICIYLFRSKFYSFFKWIFKIIATVEHQKQLEESAVREEAIKHLNIKIRSLTSEITSLKSKNEDLIKELRDQQRRHDKQIEELTKIINNLKDEIRK